MVDFANGDQNKTETGAETDPGTNGDRRPDERNQL
jgi:hypothetical protein